GEIDPKGDGTMVPGRSLNVITLQGRNATLSAFQAYEDTTIQTAYVAFVANPGPLPLGGADAQAWGRLVTDLSATVTAGTVVQVPCAVLALTQNLITQSPPDVSTLNVPDFATFLGNLGVGQPAHWSARYGHDPFEWRPFGQHTIKGILEDLLVDPLTGVNVKLQAANKLPIKWSWVDVVTPPFPTLKTVAAPFQ